MDGGKFVVIDPRSGKGPAGTFGKDQAQEAFDLQAKINEQIMAEELAAAAPKVGKIEILSADGGVVDGIATVKATDSEVFKGKDGKAKTEKDLCAIAGYVLVSRDGSGKVRAEWGNPPDFGRYVPVSRAALTQLRHMLTPAS